MTQQTLFLLLVPLVQAVIFHAAPRLSRPGIFFSVTVDEAFATGREGRTLLTRYRLIVWAAAVASIVAKLATDSPIGFFIPAGLVTVAGLCAWIWTYRQVRPHAVTATGVRTASLKPRDVSMPGGMWFAAGPFLLLAVTALIIYLRWDRIPAGTTTNPFAPLLIAGTMILMTTLLGSSIVRFTRQVATDGPAARAEQRFKNIQVLYLTVAAYMMAILFSGLAIMPVLEIKTSFNVGSIAVLIPVLNIAMLVWMLWVGQGGQRGLSPEARGAMRGDATPDSAWKGGGMLYFNPSDPAIWVEKRIGIGYTVNFANPRTWLLIGVFAVPALAARLLF
jgi:uncharacterized protein DUF5808